MRAYGQKDPLIEYKRESFDLFSEMLGSLREHVTMMLAHLEVQTDATEEDMMIEHGPSEMHESRVDPALQATGTDGVPLGGYAGFGGDYSDLPPVAPVRTRQGAEVIDKTDPSTWGRVSRNAACPCGSGKKDKHCHGQVS